MAGDTGWDAGAYRKPYATFVGPPYSIDGATVAIFIVRCGWDSVAFDDAFRAWALPLAGKGLELDNSWDWRYEPRKPVDDAMMLFKGGQR